jgi:pyruvate formate lyase activating enzyme
MTGNIFAIKRYAIHDGPNIRTTIFLKGCPLKCWWCHNPEGMDSTLSLIWNKEKCIGCGDCLNGCPTQSLSMAGEGIVRNDATCEGCHECVSICPALAHEAVGWKASVDEIIKEIKKDTPFYDESGGGVTFSGGEPLMQSAFLLELLRECGRLGVHRAVDTSAFAETDLLLKVAEHCELFLVDLKHMDSEKHRLYTGVPNELIRKNICELVQRGHALHIRIPLIEGVNNDEENMRLSGEFLAGLLNPPGVDLLPYHSTAGSKYTKMGRENPGVEFKAVSRERVAACAEVLTRMGLNVQIGG